MVLESLSVLGCVHVKRFQLRRIAVAESICRAVEPLE